MPCKTETEDNCEYGELVDERDGQTYKTVIIGSQTWMAQNLNFQTANSYCYDDNDSNCTKYGRLYTWGAATTACPSGWHLPSKDEWKFLFNAVGGYSVAVTKLRSTFGWIENSNGSDDFSFSALPAGLRNLSADYIYEGRYTHFWSSTEYANGAEYSTGLDSGVYSIDLDYYGGLAIGPKYYGYSVRCLEDDVSGQTAWSSSSSQKVESSSSEVPEPVEGSLTDSRDGQIYKTMTIGTQTWMAENLNYETANSSCYNDDASNCTKYGRLYTWDVAMDSAGTWSENGKGCGYGLACSPTYPVRGVCPDGWHLPTQAEWDTLFTTVGGSSVAAKKLKSSSGWYDNRNGTDDFSFSALPAGYRDHNGNDENEGEEAYFWSSTEDDRKYMFAYFMNLYYYDDDAGLFVDYKSNGFSVRCLKD